MWTTCEEIISSHVVYCTFMVNASSSVAGCPKRGTLTITNFVEVRFWVYFLDKEVRKRLLHSRCCICTLEVFLTFNIEQRQCQDHSQLFSTKVSGIRYEIRWTNVLLLRVSISQNFPVLSCAPQRASQDFAGCCGGRRPERDSREAGNAIGKPFLSPLNAGTQKVVEVNRKRSQEIELSVLQDADREEKNRPSKRY